MQFSTTIFFYSSYKKQQKTTYSFSEDEPDIVPNNESSNTDVKQSLVDQINNLKNELELERETSKKIRNDFAHYRDRQQDHDGNSSSLLQKYNLLEEELEEEKSRSKTLSNELNESRIRIKVAEEIEKKMDASGNTKDSLYEATKKLVKEGDKNFTLALELQKTREQLSEITKEVHQFRSTLFQGINGGVANVDNYSHVGIGELLRIRIQQSEQQSTQDYTILSSAATRRDTSLSESTENETSSNVGSIQKMEKKLMSVEQRNQNLTKKCSKLEAEIQSSGSGSKRMNDINKKMAQITERSRYERDARMKVENDLSVANKKVDALSDHIEKLMIHLKHEAIAKVRALSEKVRIQREVEMLRHRNMIMAKRNGRKDRAIIEIREGGKILEDQLRLMDEKYMELRMKLDWTRIQSERVIKKKEEEARELRAKFIVFDSLSADAMKKVRLMLCCDVSPGAFDVEKNFFKKDVLTLTLCSQ